MIFLQLFTAFFKTGLFAIGGGLATLPFLMEISEKYGWFSSQMVADMLAVSESTPGPIGVNMATYAGYLASGIPGALMATVSLVLPSLIIILIISGFMSKFRENRFVNSAFLGLRPAVVALICVAFWEVLKASVLHWDAFLVSHNFGDLWNVSALIFMAVLLLVSQVFKKMHPIVLIGIGAVAGILFHM